MNGGGLNGIKSPEAAADISGGTMYIVVGKGNSNSRGGPSSNHIFALTTVSVVAGTRVVPAMLAIGAGGIGKSVPSTDAIGEAVLDIEGNGD